MLLMLIAATYMHATNRVVWEADASIVHVDIRYNHVLVTLQTPDGRKIDTEDGRLIMEYFNDGVTVFHCKLERYGNGSCQ